MCKSTSRLIIAANGKSLIAGVRDPVGDNTRNVAQLLAADRAGGLVRVSHASVVGA